VALIDLKNWKSANYPDSNRISGQYCYLEALSNKSHSDVLFREFQKDNDNSLWKYLPYGPFYTINEFSEFIEEKSNKKDPKFYAIIDIETDEAIGFSSYLRIDENNGVIEIGHLAFSPRLQKTRIATEAIYLLIKYALSLGYRRIEWKCNDKNIASKNSALRLGFKYEGLFRQAAVVKGENRDTAWFSIIDIESDTIVRSLEKWLSIGNFDSNRKQINKLSFYMEQEKIL
jgi:RimJ/RimL family protein N-acetyltransferase